MENNSIGWFGTEGSEKILYINTGTGWKPYTHPSFGKLRVPDYEIAGGSKGYATMQKLLKLGFKMEHVDTIRNEINS